MLGIGDDMGVGDDEPPTGVHDDAGSQALRLALARLVGHIEEVAEERVVQERVAAHPDLAFGRDVDHGGHDLFEHGRETRRLAPEPGRGRVGATGQQ